MPETIKSILSMPELRSQKNVRKFLVASVLIVMMYLSLVFMYFYSTKMDIEEDKKSIGTFTLDLN